MKISERLLQLHRDEQVLGLQRLRLWSEFWREWLLYLLFRSRGFVGRLGANLSMEVVETVGIALCASPMLTYASSSMVVVNLVLAGLFEGCFQAFRSRVLEEKRVGVGVYVALVSLVSVACYGFVGFIFLWEAYEIPWYLVALVATRFVTSVVDHVLFARATDISIRKRIYFNPWINLVLLAGGALLVGASILMPPSFAFVTVVAGMATLRLLGSVLYFKAALRAEKEFEKETRQAPAPPSPLGLDDLKRIVLMLSHYFVPLALYVYGHLGLLFNSALGFWLMRSLVLRFSERPMRAIYVDVVQAFAWRRWAFIASRVRLSFLTSLALWGLIAFVGILLHASLKLTASIGWIWLMSSVLMHVLHVRQASLGLDTTLSKPILFRCLASVAWIVGVESLGAGDIALLTGMLGVDLVSLAWIFTKLSRLETSRLLDYRHYSSQEESTSGQISPAGFLGTYRALTPLIAELNGGGLLLLVKLASPIRSAERMEPCLRRMRSSLRGSDRIMALSARTVLIWAPTAREEKPLVQRLFLRNPLLIDSIESLGKGGLVSVLESPEPLRSFEMISARPLSLATYLEIVTQETSKGKIRGQWWCRGSDGQWHSLEGTASPKLNQYLFSLESKVSSEVHYMRSRSSRAKFSTETFFSLAPFGELIAVFACSDGRPLVPAVIEATSKRFVASVDGKRRAEDAMPAREFFEAFALLRELDPRLNFAPLVVAAPDKSVAMPGGGRRFVAFTKDGAGSSYHLSIRANETT